MEKPLSEMSVADFKALEAQVSAEAGRRIKVAQEARQKRHEVHETDVRTLLRGVGVIDVLRPRHDRNDCADDNQTNGMNSDADHFCTRCALLELAGESLWPELPEGKWVRLELSDCE